MKTISLSTDIPKLAFKAGSKKIIKNLKYVSGKKIASFPLEKNSYGLSYKYYLDGYNSKIFKIDEQGTLFWNDNILKPKQKKLKVTIIAESEITDIYTSSNAKLNLVIYPKK